MTAGTAASATYTINEAASADSQLFREVRSLYERVLGREPDTGGFNFWTCVNPQPPVACANLGIPGLGQMVDDFLTSPEGMNTDFQVLALYKAILNRAPTFAEWRSAALPFRQKDNPAGWLAAGQALANALVSSNEFAGAFGSPTDTAVVVSTLYQNALGRSPLTAEHNNGVATVSGGGTGGVYALLSTILGTTPAGLIPARTSPVTSPGRT